MDKAAEAVKEAIMNGIDLLREGAGIDVTSLTFITQICATIVLFLFVRFFFWDKVTAIIEKRKASVQETIDKRDSAEAEYEQIKANTTNVVVDAKKEVDSYVQDAKAKSEAQADAIVLKAKEDAAKIISDAKKEAIQEKANMQEEIKNEIIDVAYELAKKITSENIDKEKDQELVNKFIEDATND